MKQKLCSFDMVSAGVFLLIPIALFLFTSAQREMPIILGVEISQTPEPDLLSIGQWLLLLAPAVFCSLRNWMMQNAVLRFSLLRTGSYRKWWQRRMLKVIFINFLYSLYAMLLFMLHYQMQQYWIAYIVLFNLHLDMLCIVCIVLSSISKNGIGFTVVFVSEGLGYILSSSNIGLNRYMLFVFGMTARSELLSSDFGYSTVAAAAIQLLIIILLFMLPKKALERLLNNNNKEKIK